MNPITRSASALIAVRDSSGIIGLHVITVTYPSVRGTVRIIDYIGIRG